MMSIRPTLAVDMAFASYASGQDDLGSLGYNDGYNNSPSVTSQHKIRSMHGKELAQSSACSSPLGADERRRIDSVV